MPGDGFFVRSSAALLAFMGFRDPCNDRGAGRGTVLIPVLLKAIQRSVVQRRFPARLSADGSFPVCLRTIIVTCREDPLDGAHRGSETTIRVGGS